MAKIQQQLRMHGTVPFEGMWLQMTKEGHELEAGETYVAERNSGPKLLTVWENDEKNGWIIPVEIAYVFDTYECVGVHLLESIESCEVV